MNKKLLDGRFVFGLLKDTFNDWLEDGALRLSAALSYYSIFSIAPLLVICLGVAGWASWLLGPDAVDKYLYGELTKILGPQSVEVVRSMVKSATHPSASKLAALGGAVLLLVGAGSVFGQLKDALNTIWEVKAKPGLGIKVFLRQRLLTFGMVVVIGFLLLVSLVLSAGVAAFSNILGSVIPAPWLLAPLGILLGFGVVTVLFALIFKVLPDATVDWKHVWVGAAVTAVLFEIGKLLLGLYLARPSTSSSYGAAGAVVLVLLWVYYASCILFFGAEFTQTYAKATGAEIRPNQYAEPVTSEMRAQQGLSPAKREEPPPRPAEIVTVGVYSPPPATPFPRHLRDLPGYLRDSPGASLLTAAGCGFAVGLASRALDARRQRRGALEEISHGSRELAHGSGALAVAALPFLANLTRRFWGKAKKRLEPKALRKTARQLREAVVPLVLCCAALTAHGGEKPAAASAAREDLARLQVFLDRANFGPGKIDGRNGEFTRKALGLPPGPNNPVGVMWIALDKKGIGIHGTEDPDSIGRSSSHGCIRLANWDVVNLAGMVHTGVPVTIE